MVKTSKYMYGKNKGLKMPVNKSRNLRKEKIETKLFHIRNI